MVNHSAGSPTLRVLLIEDSDVDARFILNELRLHGYELQSERVETEPTFRAALASRWDVIIADYRLPCFGAAMALRIVQEQQIDVPFIIVSGTIGEDVAVAAMKAGAHDYVMKGKLARLVPVVERELREAQVRRARARAERESRFQADLLKAVGQAVVATNAEGKITYWNRPAETLYGWSATEALDKNLSELILTEGSTCGATTMPVELKQGQNWCGEIVVHRRDSVSLTALVMNSPVYDTAGNVAGMVQVATDVTERKQAELQLENSREQLRALTVKLQSVREEERKRLSRDIHDELGQVLTGFKMELAWMRSRLNAPGPVPREALLDKITIVGSQIDASANTIRKLCSELRPGILDDLGLLAAIDWQARDFSKRTGIQCQIISEINNPPLDPDGNTAVFRIFQEVLTNVARHAQASKVTVSLVETETMLILEARDDGRGIRPADLTGANSLGLLGMRERAMALGGNIDFEGHQSSGTTVTLEVPLKKLPPAVKSPRPKVKKPRVKRR
jgi:two-component system sensor histidine kinase UhpB